MITTKPVGRVSLQDESPKSFQTIEGDSGDDLLLNGSVHIGGFAIDRSNSAGANANSAIVLEGSVPRGSRPPDNEGGFLLREDAVILNKGYNLLMTEEILDQAPGGLMMINGTDGSSTDAGSYLQFEAGTYSSLLGTALAFLPRGQEAESFDNTLRTTFDSTNQTYDVLAGD
jgi:hypothetical protein